MRNRQWWQPLLLSLMLQTALLGDFALVKAENTLKAEAASTVEKKRPHLIGIRVEPLDEQESTFAGYTPSGVSVVHPDSRVRVVLFGWYLDEVTDVSFTSEGNCTETTRTFAFNLFQTQLGRRIVIVTDFPSASNDYKICIRQKPDQVENGDGPPPPFFLSDDAKTWITTRLPPRQYYLPMYLQISIILFLLVLSGLFSGLNLGLMSLSPQELELIQRSGSKSERRYAETILPVRRTGNFLLCSLLIGNVLVNSAISILFDDLTSGYVALIVSSFGIVIFGEIVPQSICVKKGLKVGYQTIWITRFFMVLTFPISWPIGKILDLVLGDEVTVYDRKRLMELIKINTRSEGGHLAEELKIAVGAMEMSDKTVKDVMTKVDDVFMLPDTTVLNTKTVAEILRMGYTRIPVYQGDRNTIVALLFVKDLALLDPDDNFTIKTVCGYNEHPLRFVMEDTPLRVMLEEFKKGDYHLAIVQTIVQPEEGDPFYELTGIVTLEDIVEEILQAEIVDETDAYTDNVNRTRRRDVQARDLTRILENDAMMSASISVQLQLVTMQWLTANQPAFHPDLIGPNVLERLIRQHVRIVEFSNLTAAGDINTTVPRTAKLYTKQEPSERFVLILEGRVTVTIGQNEMQFEAGPWHCFGEEVLRKLVEVAPALAQNAIPHAATGLSFSRQSLTGDAPDSRKRHAASFIPDFSAVVKDDCTYLEITVHTYLSAYRATLMQKGTRPISLHAMTPDEVTHGHVATALLTRQGRGSIGCVSSARDLDRRKLSEIDRRVRGGSRPSLHENSSFHRDAEGIRATIGSPKEAQKLLAALGLRKKVSAAPERHPSEEGEVSKMVELAATKATKAGAQEQPRRASPEDDGDDDGGGNDDDDTVDLRLNLDGLSSSSTTPRPTSTASRTNLIVKANGSDIGKNEGDAV